MVQVVCGVIERDGRVLIALRGEGMRDPGCWEFAGGKVEAGESFAEALRRELMEELGVSVQVGEKLCAIVEPPIELRTFRCALIEGEPQALEHEEVRWVLPQELHTFSFAAADRATVRLLQGHSKPNDKL